MKSSFHTDVHTRIFMERIGSSLYPHYLRFETISRF